MLMMDDIAECDELQFNVDITVHDHQRTLDHYSDLRVDSDRERNGEGIGIHCATNQLERRWDLSDARIQSLAAIIDQAMNRMENSQKQSIQRTTWIRYVAAGDDVDEKCVENQHREIQQ